jgi:hypothetical protein
MSCFLMGGWGEGDFAIECVKKFTYLIAKGGFGECSLSILIIYNNNIMIDIQGWGSKLYFFGLNM